MKLTFRTALVIVLVALLMAALPQPTGASPPPQAANEVTYDVPVEGIITNESFTQDWTLTPPSADRIAVRVERLDGNLIPSVSILDNNGQVVANSYGADRSYAAAEIHNFTLPLLITYTIRVERQDPEFRATTGAYRLTVTLLGAAVEHPNNGAPIGPVELDTPVTGVITPEHWWHIYTLDASAGDYIQVQAQRARGTIIPEVRLLDNNGQELTRGYASSLGDVATINGYDLPYTGQFQVVVLRETEMNGDTTGEYQLTVHLLGSGEESERLAAISPGMFDQYNTTQSGTITGTAWYRDWQFRTDAGDTISIIARRAPEYSLDAPNNLAPLVILLDSTGQELTRGYGDQSDAQAMIDHYTLPEAGQYTVRVTRAGLKTGDTTGTYDVELILNGTGEESPALSEPAGLITAGTPVTGILDAARWLHIWTFSGEAGQEISLEAARTEGTLVPHLEIRDAGGATQTYAYPEDALDAARIDQYRLPYTGEYQVVVYRDGEQGGQTTGSYSLTIQ